VSSEGSGKADLRRGEIFLPKKEYKGFVRKRIRQTVLPERNQTAALRGAAVGKGKKNDYLREERIHFTSGGVGNHICSGNRMLPFPLKRFRRGVVRGAGKELKIVYHREEI